MVTKRKDKGGYPRVLVMVDLKAELVEEVWYEDKLGILEEQTVRYESKPILCDQCKGYGHAGRDCRGGVGKRVWKPKEPIVEMSTEIPTEQGNVAPATGVASPSVFVVEGQ